MSGGPIFVVGYQRSGTTLLQAILGAHPSIAAPPELHYVSRVAEHTGHFGDLHDDANLRRALHAALNPNLPVLDECGFDEDALFERARHTDRTYASLLDAILGDFAERQGKPRWCEKTPTQRARNVLWLLPHAQVVHIVRDPRDVVASSLQMPWNRLTARQLAVSWRSFTVDNCQVGAAVGPRQFHQVRYEDLTRDPETILRRVCDFLGEPFAPQMVSERGSRVVSDFGRPWQDRVAAPVGAAPPGWRQRMRPHDRARVAAVVARELALLGYSPPRPSTVATGRLLNVLLAPTDLPRALERLRIRLTARTPERRYEELQRHLADLAATMRAA